jgi:hypothetical protein
MNNKKFKSINNNNNNKIDLKRDSFSDRFCDDLCEVLFIYLSLEDKIKFECVSKQWQKLVFNKQYSIGIKEYGIQMKNDLDNLLITFSECIKHFNYKAFESVLKKCKFINNIIIDFNYFNDINTEQVLQLIIKNCNHLKSITFDFNKISDQLMQKFGQKFGQKLHEISFIDGNESNDNIIKYAKLLRLCPNLVSLGDKYSTHLSLFVDSNELLLPKLIKVKTTVQSKGDIKLFETFAKTYANSLKNISLQTESNLIHRLNQNETNFLMKQIIYLKNLNHLELWLDFKGNSSEEFINNLKAIAIHCNQLKSFNFKVSKTKPLLHKYIFNCLGFYKSLNHLELSFIYFGQQNNQISCESLEELKLLINLKVENLKMKDIFFEDIDKHLPQLKRLDITVDNFIITDKAMNSLSKLSKLQSIKIRCPEDIYEETDDILPFITDIGLLNVINNCSQINSIEFYGRPNISHKTIDALIALALRKPKIYFKHRFDDIWDSAEDIYFNVIDLKSYQLPNNLVID